MTGFREDLMKVTVPTLVIHGDPDVIVSLESSGQRTHCAALHSKLVTVKSAQHGLNVSHAQAFHDALLSFLRRQTAVTAASVAGPMFFGLKRLASCRHPVVPWWPKQRCAR